jgi:hypothetical protein
MNIIEVLGWPFIILGLISSLGLILTALYVVLSD